MDSVSHLLNNWGQIYKVYHAQTMRQLDYTYVVVFFNTGLVPLLPGL